MSELSGRAANGGARTAGPVPVSSTTTSSTIRPPTEIMRARNAREQRRQEEQKADEQRRALDERRRRESAERRAAVIQGTAAPRTSQASSQYTPESQQQQFDNRRSATGNVAGSATLGDPTGRTSQDRARRPSVSQQDQSRPMPAAAGTTRRTQASQQAPRQPTMASTAAAGTSRPEPEYATPGGAATDFPHAFHRWETLSSHWEGLTSYWLRKLESNTDEIRDTVPNITTLGRQIADLSAAGANLFHAVVELQRLRASSERKFQRWFFDSRGENEKYKEIQAQLENQIRTEREEASRQRADALVAAENARRDAQEARLELKIAKEEARRAWDELGRRSEEAQSIAQNLKAGNPTIVAGVQVMPVLARQSEPGSVSQRPVTRDGQGYYSSAGSAGGGFGTPGDEAAYYYQQQQQEERSPVTDPFTDTGPSVAAQYQDPNRPRYQQPPYQVGGTPASSSTAQTVVPTSAQRAAAAQDPQRFYQHTPQETYLHESSQSAQAGAGGAQRVSPLGMRSEPSYVGSPSEGDNEYAMGGNGNMLYDSEGQPIPSRRRRPTNESEEDDEYDTEADIRREQEHSARYGTGAGLGGGILPEAPTVPASSAQAMATYATPTTSAGGQEPLRPDYEGADYGGGSNTTSSGGSAGAGWDSMQPPPTRHHHPTRLSDVVEEEEERSSRRSRADD